MKPARFIMNTDYAMMQNDKEFELSVDIPASWVQPGHLAPIVEFKSEIAIEGAASRDFRLYLTSTAFNFALANAQMGLIEFGNDLIEFKVEREANKFILKVWGGKNAFNDKTYSGTAQTLTAHIQTFKDPFSEK